MKRILALCAVGLALGAILAPAGGARLLPPDAEPMQLSYRLWAVQWMKGALQRNPQAPTSLLAVRPGQCGYAFGKVWLLPAAITGVIDTHCRIPEGKVILVSVTGSVSVAGPEANLRRDARAGFDEIATSELRVDGRHLGSGYVVATPLFVVKLPPGNLVQLPPGLTDVVVKGYFALLAPLARGEHTIVTRGVFTDGQELGMNIRVTVR